MPTIGIITQGVFKHFGFLRILCDMFSDSKLMSAMTLYTKTIAHNGLAMRIIDVCSKIYT